MFVFDVHRFRAKRSSVLEKASEEHRLCWKQVFGFVWWAGARGFCLGTLGRAPPLPCVRTSECNVRVWVENKRRRAKAGVKHDQGVFAAPAFLPAGAAGLTREYIYPEIIRKCRSTSWVWPFAQAICCWLWQAIKKLSRQ